MQIECLDILEAYIKDRIPSNNDTLDLNNFYTRYEVNYECTYQFLNLNPFINLLISKI